MKYFITQDRKDMTCFPCIRNWYNNIDVEAIQNGNYEKLNRFTTFFVTAEEPILFPDIINYPFLMVSEELFKVIKHFEPNLKMSRIVLIDPKDSQMATYYLPWLMCVDEIIEEYFLKRNSQQSFLMERKNNIETKTVFAVKNKRDNKKYTVFRIDLLETLLRRDYIGMDIKEVMIQWKEE